MPQRLNRFEKVAEGENTYKWVSDDVMQIIQTLTWRVAGVTLGFSYCKII